MKLGLLCRVAILMVTLLQANGEDGLSDNSETCPSICVCEVGTSHSSAKCSSFDNKLQFPIDITHLDLSNIPKSKGMQLSDHIFTNVGLKRVAYIKITNSSLNSVNVNAFHGLHNLNDLNLSNNNLTLLEPDMFANNTHLEILILNQNPLQFMQEKPSPYNGYFLNVPYLQELYLSSCNLSQLLPTMFTNLTHLTRLDLSSNEITDILSDTFTPLLDLFDLDLSNNKISQLKSDVFAGNTELGTLKLSNNPLSSLKGVNMSSVQELDLSHCKFTKIEQDTFHKLEDINNLDLSGNEIVSIDSNAFQNMNKLQYLDLSNNKLVGQLAEDIFINNYELETLRLQNNPDMKSFPEKGFQGKFSELYLLDASGCGLTHLYEDSLKRFDHLITLNLSRNDIQYLKPGVLSPKIIILDLSRNKIAHLDQVSFPQGSSLKKLYLSENPLKKLSPKYFMNVRRLVRLDLSSCDLRQLWEINDMYALKALNYLNIKNNKITKFSVNDLVYIEHIQTLILAGNPLTCTNDLKEAFKYLNENGVASSDATERKELEEMREDIVEELADIPPGKDKFGWKSFLYTICKKKENLIFPESNTEIVTESDSTPFYDLDYTEHFDKEDIFIDDLNTDDDDDVDNNIEEEIHKEPVRRRKTNYMWPIIIVSLSAFAIILALVVLSALLLRWTRQKNSYRNTILRRQSFISTPRLKRGGSSTMYRQLYEEANTPTTPVMTSKLFDHSTEQQTYTFPEPENVNGSINTESTQQNTNASYHSTPFHHSNIVPETM